MALQNIRISFCVVCMNRLHQLQETFLQNIFDNDDYKELEFILLNYNSQDGMDDWVKENLADQIACGKLIYYHTIEPKEFSHSHAKNMVFKLASGDIICSINADHFTGKGFATYVNVVFNENSNAVLTTVDYFKINPNYNPPKDVFGRVCVKKSDFLKVGGFDEKMENYGFEDWDFVNRLELLGCKRVLIEDFSYLNYIPHTEQERYSIKNSDKLYRFYINYLTASKSNVIVLFTDNTFKQGTLIDNFTVGAEDRRYAYTPRNSRFEFSLEQRLWRTGTWVIANKSIQFYYDSGSCSVLISEDADMTTLLDTVLDMKYFLISNSETANSLITFDYFYQNRSLMEKHLEEEITIVNRDGFGLGNVKKNYNSTPLFT